MILLAVVGPVFAPYDPEAASPVDQLLPPSGEHWFGTDAVGLDVFSRTISAPRADVPIALTATILALLVGVPLGVTTGYFSDRPGFLGFASEVLLRAVDVLQAIPVFIFAMALVAVGGPSATNVIAALAFLNAPIFLRLARAEVLSLRSRSFVEAARCAGCPERRIIFSHLMINGLGPVLTQFSVTVGFVILLTAGLSFVGAGVPIPTPEWGLMISTGTRDMITGQWWTTLFPGVFLGLTVFGFALVGEGIKLWFDPKSNREIAEAPMEWADPSPESSHPRSFYEGDALLHIEGITVEFPGREGSYPVVDKASLVVREGEVVGVIGETGSGKSVFALALVNAVPPPGRISSGSVSFRGENLLEKPEDELRKLRGDTIAIVPSEARQQLNPLERIGRQITNVVLAHRPQLSYRQAADEAILALQATQIPDPRRMFYVFPHELSGGMAQRVLVAMALVGSPELLISDEATYGLDVTVQKQVLDIIAGLVQSASMAWLVITRDPGIVAAYCDRVAVMWRGRIVEDQPTRNFFRTPLHPYSRTIVDAAKAGKPLRIADV
jgi:peptide/nickel transport system permease protein